MGFSSGLAVRGELSELSLLWSMLLLALLLNSSASARFQVGMETCGGGVVYPGVVVVAVALCDFWNSLRRASRSWASCCSRVGRSGFGLVVEAGEVSAVVGAIGV